MKIFYFSDDRSKYASGNYYLDYMDGFQNIASEMVISDTFDEIDESFDLLVIGQGGQDVLLRKNKRLPIDIATIILSKNDYKNMSKKRNMAIELKANVVVTNSRSAVPKLKQNNYRTIWLPFGSSNRFSNHNRDRKVDVGFRANRNSKWNNGVRDQFYKNLLKATYGRSVDLAMSENGEGFLLGYDYINFLNNCHLIGNTVSAVGTVGPRFIESMSCGAIPIAPYSDYECIMRGDIHYVQAETEDEIKKKIGRFLNDDKYRGSLFRNCSQFVDKHSIKNQIDEILRSL